MRENSHINAFWHLKIFPLVWCLFATSLPMTSIAEEAIRNSSQFSYDSSIQRSGFIPAYPTYLRLMDKNNFEKRSSFGWKLEFSGQSLETDQNQQSQAAGAGLTGRWRYRIMNRVNFIGRARMRMESGRSQDIFGDLEPQSGIYPTNAKLEVEPIKGAFKFDVGLIRQRWFYEPLFIGNLGFPGADQKLKFSWKRFELKIRTQQLIPTSSTLSARVAEKEEVPNLFTETVTGKFLISRSNFFIAQLTHFKYQNLPSIVAFESFIYGNTVNAPDVNNARFVYGFDGLLSQFIFEQKFSNSLSTQIKWDTIQNGQAPESAGEARRIKVVTAYDTGRWILAGEYNNFFVESDAVPAFYNSHIYGHNNRIGHYYGLMLESKDWGVTFNAGYTDADLLNPARARFDGLQQENQQTFFFSVETTYDFI